MKQERPKTAASKKTSARFRRAPVKRTAPLPFPVVGIGASPGSMAAVRKFIGAIPRAHDVAFVVILQPNSAAGEVHPGPISGRAKMPVVPVKDGLRLKPSQVYFCDKNRKISINAGKLHVGKPA